MSLPLLHAGRTNPGLSAALDLRFALDKSLTAYRGPTPSFSRASTGSYFDGSGVLRYAALNLLTYSEDFTNAVWAKTNATITANAILSPDGKLTADKISEDSASAKHRAYVTPSVTVGTIYTFSVYAKSAERNWLAMNYADTNANMYAYFNLQNGTIGSVDASMTASITSVGNGWYRCSVTKTLSAAGPNFDVGPTTGDGVFSYAGTIGSGIYIWGAQLEASSTVGTYCPTTSSANSAPRFNHTFNGTSWVSRGLLVEEQRTNLIQYSDISTDWNATNATKSSTSETSSPDGGNNAKKLVENLVNSVHGVNASYLTISPTLTNGLTYTGSCFVKSGSRTKIMIASGTGRLVITTKFDLNNSSVISSSATSNSITNVGNGWFRISATGSATSSGDSQFSIYILDDSGNETYTGNGSGSIYLWGFQVEQASFPTSYIGTTNSSVVRSADVCQITGGDFSGFWNGTEGTFAVDFDRLSPLSAGGVVYPRTLWVGDGVTGNFINHYSNHGSPYDEQFTMYSGGALQFSFSGYVNSGTNLQKYALAFKNNDSAVSNNGGAVQTDNTCTVPTVPAQMSIGYLYGSTNYVNGHIARLRYFNKRLPNATLQLLSEPDPTLNLQFALNKSLTPVAGPAPSFSRASTGTYFNASGVLTSASINTPRFDHVYSGGQWVSRGLLLEEQRTNTVQYSNDLTNAAWGLSNTTRVAASSPDGNNTAARITGASSTLNVKDIIAPGNAGATGTWTGSIYAKAGTHAIVQIRYSGSDVSAYANFDLVNGVVGSFGGTSASASMTPIGGGWYRCRHTYTVATGTSGTMQISLQDTTTAARGGSSTSTGYLDLWGGQFESGAFATSLIVSTNSSTTRSADVCQITGTSFNWMWNQGEGGFAVEYDQSQYATGANNYAVAALSSGTALVAITSSLYGGSPNTYWQVYNGTAQAEIPFSMIQNGTAFKFAGAYKANDFAATQNGAAVGTDTSGSVPSANQMSIGYFPGYGQYINGHIAKLIYYPARLTNAKLQQLST